jgi:ANTAR domain/GAF domain
MSIGRLSVVLEAMARAGEHGDRSISVIDQVCEAGVALLSLKGAGVSLMVDGQLRGTAGVSDPGIEAVQELQLTLGEGPCVDAWKSCSPVLEPALADPAVLRWPAFAPAGVLAGVQAVFALPLALGAIQLGVLVLYRDRPGVLDAEELATGLVLAEVATQVLLALQAAAPTDALHELLSKEPPHWAEVHQATGMVSVQLGVSLDEAYVRLRAHAFAQDVPLRTVAREIVTRRLRLGEAG